MSNIRTLAFLIFPTACLTACNDGSSSSDNPAAAYSFVTPEVNAHGIASRIIIDNSNNVIRQTISTTVTVVNPDGSFEVAQEDPTGASVTLNGTTYSVETATITNSKYGQVLSYKYTPSGGSPTTCIDDPHGLGPDYPVLIGTSWSTTFTYTCGSKAAILYSQTGSVVGVEPITVRAGTFNTLKIQSTVTWTNSEGTTFTDEITSWLEIIGGADPRNIGIRGAMKEIQSITASGTPPTNGYAVSITGEAL